MRGHLQMGEPAGRPDRIEATSRWLERAGRPFLPVMAEFHYPRCPPNDWAEEIAALKAGGITVVASYVFWLLHEEYRGCPDFTGQRDLRRFVQLCGAAGLDVVVRIGPWGHGEMRNGGFPDWVVAEFGERARTDDPSYLAAVRPFFAVVAEQLTGLFHVDGGPIIGVQLENELYDEPEHLRTLKAMAIELGMGPALWTATGWGGAVLPRDEVVPLYAGYSDGFWFDATDGWPAHASAHFQFTPVRDDLSVGADVRELARPQDTTSCTAQDLTGRGRTDGSAKLVDEVPDDERYPYATCELGGGMHVAYHRRPLVDPADVSALALTKLGSGSVWQGYYMFHGGSQLKIDSGWSQESHATGYPNDLPQVSYDFRAPIGEFGQLRPHFHALRAQHLMLAAFGDRLARMAPYLPAQDSPDGHGDGDGGDGVRWAVRSDGETGVLLVNNHQPVVEPLPDRTAVQFEIDCGNRRLLLPSNPVDIAGGTHLLWPLGWPLTRDIRLHSATAQPLTVLPIDSGSTPGAGDVGAIWILVASPGIPVELVFAGSPAVTTDPGVELKLEQRISTAGEGGAGEGGVGGLETLISLRSPPSERPILRIDEQIEILILEPTDAARAWRVDVGGRARIVLSAADVLPWADGGLLLRSPDPRITLEICPADGLDVSSWQADGAGIIRDEAVGRFRTVEIERPIGTTDQQGVQLTATQLAKPELLPPVRFGPLGRASAPAEEAWAAAVRFRITVDPVVLTADRTFLSIDWSGDVARLSLDGELVADQFFAGDPFEVDLGRWRTSIQSGAQIELAILPLPLDTTSIYLDPRIRPAPEAVSATVRQLSAIHRTLLTFCSGAETCQSGTVFGTQTKGTP